MRKAAVVTRKEGTGRATRNRRRFPRAANRPELRFNQHFCSKRRKSRRGNFSTAADSRGLATVLKSHRMPRLKASRRPFFEVPARGEAVVAIIPRRRVQPQTGDHGKGVTIARVNCDPFPAPFFSVMQQLARAQRHTDQTRRRQRVGNRPRTIVAAINKGTMSAAPTIRPAAQLVRRPDRALHRQRRTLRRAGDGSAQLRKSAGHGRSAERKRIGRCLLHRRQKNQT